MLTAAIRAEMAPSTAGEGAAHAHFVVATLSAARPGTRPALHRHGGTHDVRSIRTLALGAATTALLVSSFGVPAAAAGEGTLAIVNGFAGRKVDVCLNGREIRSKMPYGGRKIVKGLSKGTKNLKFFRKDPRKCKGRLLGKRSFFLPEAGDRTLVLTKRKPNKVVMFKNTNLGTPAVPSFAIARRHASDIGPVDFHVWQSQPVPTDPTPAAVPWLKGDDKQTSASWSFNLVYYTKVTRAGTTRTIAGPVAPDISPHRRYEVILIGDALRNLRLIVLSRLIQP